MLWSQGCFLRSCYATNDARNGFGSEFYRHWNSRASRSDCGATSKGDLRFPDSGLVPDDRRFLPADADSRSGAVHGVKQPSINPILELSEEERMGPTFTWSGVGLSG